MDESNEQAAIEATRQWLERAVIGLNLCPFAKAAVVRDTIRIVVSPAETVDALAADLERELRHLGATPTHELETTLIVHPSVLRDFFDYNDFLDVADAMVEALELDGVVQVASFHPDYCFADAEIDDPANCTNRSPYPTLHLLREESVDRAVAAVPDTDRIYERNIELMRRIGADGFRDALAGKPPRS